GDVIGRVRSDADPERGIILPDLHVRREPHRQRVVAGPLEGLALGDEGIVVAFRPAYRLWRRLAARRRHRQAEGGNAGPGGEADPVGEECTTVVIDLCHGNVLPAANVRWLR